MCLHFNMYNNNNNSNNNLIIITVIVYAHSFFIEDFQYYELVVAL